MNPQAYDSSLQQIYETTHCHTENNMDIANKYMKQLIAVWKQHG